MRLLPSYACTHMRCLLIKACSLVTPSLCFYFFQAPNPRLPTNSQLPGQLSQDQPDVGPAIPPPVPVVGKLTVKGKFDFSSVSHDASSKNYIYFFFFWV